MKTFRTQGRVGRLHQFVYGWLWGHGYALAPRLHKVKVAAYDQTVRLVVAPELAGRLLPRVIH